MPRTIVGKKYTKMFMRFYLVYNWIVHKELWMYRFIKFTRDKNRLCFLENKRDKPSFWPGFRLRSSAAVSGFSPIINQLVSSAKGPILHKIAVTMSLIKRRKRTGP